MNRAIRNLLFNSCGDTIQAIVNVFKARVAADTGTFEAESLLKSFVKRIKGVSLFDNAATFILYPCAYKASKLYAIITTSGSMDFTFVRGGTGIRLNQQLVFETIGNSIPRIDYTYTDPSILIEPSRTNLILQSGLQSTWAVSGSFTNTADTILGIPSIKLVSTVAQDGVDYQKGLKYTSMVLAMAASTTYTLSFFIEKTGSNNVFAIYLLPNTSGFDGQYAVSWNTNTLVGTVSGGYGGSYTNKSASIVQVSGNIYKVTTTFTTPAGSATSCSITLGFGIGALSNAINSEGKFGMVQLEAGSAGSSYIATTTATVTRVFETLQSGTGFGCSGDFTFMFEAKMYNFGANERLYLYNSSSETVAAFQFLSTTVRWADSKNGFSAIGGLNSNQTTRNKYILRRVGSVVSVWLNGAQQGSNYSIPSNNWGTIDNIYIPTAFGGNLFQARIYNYALTDSQCITETT